MDPAAFNALPPDQQQAILNGPGLPPPPGVESNLDNPSNGNGVAYGVLSLCVGLNAIFIGLALVTKLSHLKRIHPEDYIAIISVITWCLVLGFLYRAVGKYGFFVHQWDMQLWEVFGLFHSIYMSAIVYFITMATIKLSILLEWIRIFVPRGTRNRFFWICHAVAILNFVASMANMLILAFGCSPPEKYWNQLAEGKCLDGNATAVSASAINFFFDIVILILPQRVIWGLHLSWRKKLGISVLFAVGIAACAIACLRIVFSVRFWKQTDSTYNIASVALLCVAEQTAGILLFCMPGAPKALNILGKRAQLSTSRIVERVGESLSTGSSGKGSRNTRGTGPSQSSKYQEIDEVPLATMPSAHATAAPNRAGDSDDGPLEDNKRIVRTTQITTTRARNRHSDPGEDEYARQHPWVETTAQV
ncbi:hypothetical protein F5Y05DRAFT_366152 [Hypoxylon sp. FL0543]|nr:hypothetical protein F5Y05DRAFT_366152 [Hypoxylon sp. FL0543]